MKNNGGPWTGLILFLLLIGATPAPAEFFHDLPRNRQPCSDCHTLHYSEDGTTPPDVEPGGPFEMLRLRQTTNKLCLFCHDGSDPVAPDVLAPVAMYAGSGDEHSGAGYFLDSSGALSDNGHSLGVTGEVPFGSGVMMNLNCASCHDPHGTLNYRNILTSPSGGAGVEVQMARDVFRDAAPGDPPSPAASMTAYRESNEGYKAATSRWCAECHDELQPSRNTQANRVHHLTDVPLNGAGYPTDPSHWLAGTGAGFGAVTGDSAEGVPRLRFQVPTATDYATSRIVATTNEVICLSCHLAHGGGNRYGLVWPHKDMTENADTDSGCNQCHNK